MKDLAEDWASLTPAGRAHYRRLYRVMRTDLVEARATARDHVAVILHVQRNQAYDRQTKGTTTDV